MPVLENCQKAREKDPVHARRVAMIADTGAGIKNPRAQSRQGTIKIGPV